MADSGIYDVTGAFQQIETELIDSMTRNMRRHIGEELDEGINWSQWQAEMLRGLQQYKAENADKLPGYYSTINDKIDAAIREAYSTGESEQEIEILQKLKSGFRPDKTGPGTDAMQGAFFRTNARKLNALIDSVTSDFEAAEKAIMRRTEDAYRQIIFGAQMRYNMGAGTLWQSVDAASKDFLAAGINCVQYSNGARVNICSYAEMALRTANKRAGLMGAASKRQEYGITTVKVAARGTACPMCLPFLGRVYYDDVYSDPGKTDGKYPLLSSAVNAGLFHPNCKDGLSTYYEGVSRPAKGLTKAEAEEAGRRYALEQRQRTCERNIRKYTRLRNGAIDAQNAAEYTARLNSWQAEYKTLIRANTDVLRADPARLRLYGLDKINESTFNTPISIYKGGNTGEKVLTIDKCKTTDEVVQLLKAHNDWFHEEEINGKIYRSIDGMNLDGVDVELAKEIYKAHESLYAKYPQLKGNLNAMTCSKLDRSLYANCMVGFGNGGISVNSRYFCSLEKLQKSVADDIASNFHPQGLDYRSVYVHELGHAIDDYLTNKLHIAGYNNYKAKYVSASLRPKVMKACGLKVKDISREVSEYATKDASEWFADCFSEYMLSEKPRPVAAEFGKQLEEIMKEVK